jgi:hypothetical protein
MSYFDLSSLIENSELTFSTNHPPQVEIKGLRKFVQYQTEIIAMIQIDGKVDRYRLGRFLVRFL